jgi:hypothetical protein
MANHTLATVTLPGDMIWSDEFNWSPVQRATAYSLAGALIVDIAEKQAGRPITLRGSITSGWMRRDVLQALYALAADPAATSLQLTLGDGRIFAVTFADREPIEAAQVVDYSNPESGDWYVVTLKLIEV